MNIEDLLKDSEWDGPVVLANRIPKNVFDEIKSLSPGREYRNNLVGVFKNEHELDVSKCPLFRKHVLTLATYMFSECSNMPVFRQIKENLPKFAPFYIKDMWINRMESGSYNPLHQHYGLFSFIVYVDIPYTLEEQFSSDDYLENKFVKNGFIELIDTFTHYSNFFPIHNGVEGNMLLFPAWVKHVVYPFKNCDSHRISIAGNIHIEYNEEYSEEHF